MVDTTTVSVSIPITHYQIILSLHINPYEAIELFVRIIIVYSLKFLVFQLIQVLFIVIYADLSGD